MVRKSILTQLITLILLIAVPLIALTGYNISADFSQAQARARSELHVMRRLGEKQLESYIQNMHAMLQQLAAKQTDNAQDDEHFREIIGLLPDFYNLAVVDTAGKIRWRAGGTPSRRAFP